MNDETEFQTPDGDALDLSLDDLQAELDAARAEAANLKDQVMRFAAEAENTKRRAEREMNDARAFAIQRFTRDLLGVADILNRAVAAAPNEIADPAFKNFVAGIEMTEKELTSAFDRNGVKKISPLSGDKFDPNLHQAVSEQAANDLPAGSVINTMQMGYELFGRVLRPAMVVVAARTQKPVEETPDHAGAHKNYSSQTESLSGQDLDTDA